MPKILMPVDEDWNRTTVPNGKFGSSPFYLIVDTDNPKNDKLVKNASKKFGGNTKPIDFIMNLQPDYVFTTHACNNALDHLENAGIVPYSVQKKPIQELLMMFEDETLEIMTEGSH